MLQCCICGAEAKGKQRHNRDKGYGICERCVAEEETKLTKDEMKSYYGEEGIHYHKKYSQYEELFFTQEEELKRLYQWDRIFSEAHRRHFHINTNDQERKKLYGDVYENEKRLFSVQFNYYEILQGHYRKPQRLLFFNWA